MQPDSFRETLGRCWCFAAIVLLAAIVPANRAQAGPGPCEGVLSGPSGYRVAVLDGTLADPACTGMLEGDAIFCKPNSSSLSWIVSWANAAARTMDATGGCLVTCPSGSCFINNVGLPVELLEFGVQ